jgi:hypothetical protein
VAGLVGYGGDPAVVASRAEIERVSGQLGAVGSELFSRIFHLLPNPIHRAQVDLALPLIEYRIQRTRIALATAAENYFSADAQVAHSIESIGNALRAHPWLLNLIPKAALERIQTGGAIAFGVAQFAPGSIAASSTRLLASSTDLDERVDSVQRIGLLNDRSVKFRSVAAELRKPISSLADIGSRIQSVDASSGQVLVETYVAPNGSRTLLVYLPGTQSFSPIAGKNPFDLVTDTALLTEPENSELLKAVSAALNQSGAKGANVIFAGYSLGGIAAAALATQSGQAVSGVVTIGAPVGQFQLPENVPVLSIQHSNDPVPAASGETNPLTKNWATVSRSAELPLGTPAMEAHDLDRYRETLAMVDAETMPGVSRVRELILNQVLGSRLSKAEAFEFRR